MSPPRHIPADPLAELLRLRREAARLAADLVDARAERDEFEASCHEDPVTGLLNRRGFAVELVRALSFSRRYGTPAALLMLDLDGFKPVNDRYGHTVGDDLLKHVGATLKANLRLSDTLARYGGDEFAMLLWRVDGAVADTKARSLETALAAARCPVGSGSVAVSGSIGIAAFRPDDGPDTVVARADAAMYRRKAERRARPGLAQAMMSGVSWSSR